MRLLFVADGRSPIALNWIAHFLQTGDEVHLVSTFAAPADPRLASYSFVPVAFSALKGTGRSGLKAAPAAQKRPGGLWSGSAVRLRTSLRRWLAPLTLPTAARRLQSIVNRLQPDLIHAMRIPYEGMLAARIDAPAPLIVSVWGNDFTLHAPATPLMRSETRRALQRAAGLHADCRRDASLALDWGFSPNKPAFVLPGAGGVQRDLFYPPSTPPREPVVIQPRGVRAYVQTDAFFQSIPSVLGRFPAARFICPNMAGEAVAERWVESLNLASAVELLPAQTRSQMADLFRRAQAAVSPTTHDGTPNTLLEAMACGCLPVAGDLESIREWIDEGENGLLVDPTDPVQLAEAICNALGDEALRDRARAVNLRRIAERADHSTVMRRAEAYYRQIREGKWEPAD